MIFGECDSCGAPRRVLKRSIAYGTETYACRVCFGEPLSEDIDDLLDEIDEYLDEAKTVKDFLHLRDLESALEDARR